MFKKKRRAVILLFTIFWLIAVHYFETKIKIWIPKRYVSLKKKKEKKTTWKNTKRRMMVLSFSCLILVIVLLTSCVDIVLLLLSLQLTACVHGAAALLLPMYWQHIFIPVLPPHLLDYCWYGWPPMKHTYTNTIRIIVINVYSLFSLLPLSRLLPLTSHAPSDSNARTWHIDT